MCVCLFIHNGCMGYILAHTICIFCFLSVESLGGESEQYSMYPSNRVKRRPAPYEVELDEGRRILDLYKYGKMHFCCVVLLPIYSSPLCILSSSPLSFIH